MDFDCFHTVYFQCTLSNWVLVQLERQFTGDKGCLLCHFVIG